MDVETLIQKGKASLETKEGKNFLRSIDKHKDTLEDLGESAFARALAWAGMGDHEKAKDYHKIMKKSPEELIEGVKSSGDVFKEAHEFAEKEAEKINNFWKEITVDIARHALPFIMTLI